MATEIIGRADARASGLNRYFTGERCKHGHVSVRLVSSGVCIACRADIEDRWKKSHPEKQREKVRRQAARHRRENPERLRKNRRKWELANPDKVIARVKRWAEANPDRKAAHGKKWADANRDKVAKKNRDYKTANAERLKPRAIARTAQWREDNPEKAREIGRKSRQTRRAREHAADGSYTNEQINALLEKQKWKCAGHNCSASLRDGKELDHIKPLARKGSNDISNLQWLCVPCNRKKRDKDPLEWARENGRLL